MKEREKITPEMAQLGAAIQRLRNSIPGLSTAALAEQLGVTDQAVKKMQRGAGTGQFLKLATLCRLLGVSPNELLGFSSAGDDERVQGVLESAARELGLNEVEASNFAEIVLEVIKAPPIQSVELSSRQAGLVQGEIAFRKSGRVKPS